MRGDQECCIEESGRCAISRVKRLSQEKFKFSGYMCQFKKYADPCAGVEQSILQVKKLSLHS